MAPPPDFPEDNPFNDNNTELNESGLFDENGKVKFKKIFANRKKPSGMYIFGLYFYISINETFYFIFIFTILVRAKEKRIRQNRSLRKTIIPKNALMALNELKGVSVGDFVINNNPSGGFIAVVTCNNNQYEGRGVSKMVAKNNACEKALRDYIIAKMSEKPRKLKNGSSTTNLKNEAMETDEADDTVDDTDDVPMVNLASFAIYKLFSEWQNEGFVIPEMHPAAAGNISDNESMAGAGAKEPKKPPIRNELPPNWEAMHPASLLCYVSSIKQPLTLYN